MLRVVLGANDAGGCVAAAQRNGLGPEPSSSGLADSALSAFHRMQGQYTPDFNLCVQNGS